MIWCRFLLLFLALACAVVASSGGDEKPLGYDPLVAPATTGKTHQFEADTKKVLDIVVRSLYKTRDVFLRELISNSADALNKIRITSLTNPKALESNKDLDIRIVTDKDNKLLIIRDTGIGMTSEHLRLYLGTIAKSGTAEFVQAMEKAAGDDSLIGKFGVGFLSAYLVADRVTVASKHNDEKEQYIWESTSDNDFVIAKDPRGNTLGRGTEITLHLKDDALEYLDEAAISKLIAKYSEFVSHPIKLWKSKTVSEDVEDTDAEDETEKASDDDSDVEDVETETDKKPKTKTLTKTVYEWQVMNENKPIWTRPASDVTDDEYKAFYKSFAKEYQDPLAWNHFKAEGDVDFKSILFIPAKAPPSFLQKADEIARNIKLFVRRVFITDELDDFMPRWLSFLKGLVDSDDLPLNVSRETLQKHGLLKAIQRKLIGKAIDMLTHLSKDAAKFKTFLKEFGLALKLGVIEDSKNRKKLVKLLRFHSSHSDEMTSLEDYVSRMKSKQPQIYFITGSSLEEIKSSPVIELPIARGYEVLYLDQPLDEYLVQQIPEFDGKKLQSLSKSGVKFGDDEKNKEKDEQLAAEFKDVADWLQTTLADWVEKVVISTRLTKSPTAIVANEYGISGNMERIMAAQALQSGDDFMRTYYSKMKKVMEINPVHPLIVGLKKRIESGKDSDELKEQAHVLYQTTLLRSGFDITNTPTFAKSVENIIRRSLNIDLLTEADVIVEPAAEKTDEEKKAEKAESKGGADEEIEEILHDEL